MQKCQLRHVFGRTACLNSENFSPYSNSVKMPKTDLQLGWLDVAGYLEGTLKSSVWVDILRHYERHFAEFKDRDIEVLEIGVNTGASLTVWKKYFTKARFIGVDINESCRQFEDDRVTIEIGSQDDPEFLYRLARTFSPTIIIDDGSHLAHHIPFTFERLFPSLPPGGVYAIEDMFFHFYPKPNRWMGYSQTQPTDYLFDIVRQLFTERPDPAVDHGIQGYLRSNVEEISFAPLGVAFIRKKSLPPPIEDRVSFGEEYGRLNNKPAIWWRLAEYILRNNGAVGKAEAAARRSIDSAPRSAQAHWVLSRVLRANRRFEEAIAAGTKAAELEPPNAEHFDFLGQLYVLANELPKAEEHFRKAISLKKDVDAGLRRRLEQVLVAQGKAVQPTSAG
jgi:tetratricopeptide (TPR) repeat protein